MRRSILWTWLLLGWAAVLVPVFAQTRSANAAERQADLDAVLADLKSADPDMQDAAVRALAAWPDGAAMPHLLSVTKSSERLLPHAIAFGGYIRLLSESGQSHDEQSRALRSALLLTRRGEEKRLALRAFSDLRGLQVLKRVERNIYDTEVSDDASHAVLAIIAGSGDVPDDDCLVAVEQVLRVSRNVEIRQRAERLLRDRGLSRIKNPERHPTTAKRIILVAGPMDHAGPGAHEYPKDLVLLKRCLDNAKNVGGLSTELHFGKLPRDLGLLEGAATLVILSSADRMAGEIHALFPAFHETYDQATRDFYRRLDGLFKQGLGLVVLHYAVWTDKPQSRAYMLDWVGGYHERGKSRVKKVNSRVQPALGDHPILNGVEPWTTQAEYYFQQRLQEDERLSPILQTTSLNHPDELDTIAWAVERTGGGRGFAFTGCHYHDNLKLEDYRQVVLNAICWTAGIEVPPEGILIDTQRVAGAVSESD